VRLSVCVQHHPARAHLLADLLTALGEAEVVIDPNPESRVRSAFRCYLECLRRTPADATHRLIVQDDAMPCDDFRQRVEAVIAERPDVLIPLFVPHTAELCRRVIQARDRGERWARMPIMWLPTVALVWPVEHAHAYLAFAEEKWDPERQRGDDSPVGVWRARSKVEAWAPVPSLVEHPDVEPSIFRRGKGQAGRNKARIAAHFQQ
jgi:hypothetical protein